MIGLSLAQYTSQVLGIELVEQAVEDARWTAAFNGTLLTFWGENEEPQSFLCSGEGCVAKGIYCIHNSGEEGKVSWSGQSWVLMLF